MPKVITGFYIEVYFDSFIMRVWENDSFGGQTHIGDYPVVLSRKECLLPQKAIITNVEFDPYWYPTDGVKVKHYEEHGYWLDDVYFPNEEMNAMGAFKWTLRFVVEPGFYKGESSVRVHEAKDASLIGTRSSNGCVRLAKEDGLFLTRLLWGYKDRVIVFKQANGNLE